MQKFLNTPVFHFCCAVVIFRLFHSIQNSLFIVIGKVLRLLADDWISFINPIAYLLKRQNTLYGVVKNVLLFFAYNVSGVVWKGEIC